MDLRRPRVYRRSSVGLVQPGWVWDILVDILVWCQWHEIGNNPIVEKKQMLARNWNISFDFEELLYKTEVDLLILKSRCLISLGWYRSVPMAKGCIYLHWRVVQSVVKLLITMWITLDLKFKELKKPDVKFEMSIQELRGCDIQFQCLKIMVAHAGKKWWGQWSLPLGKWNYNSLYIGEIVLLSI